MKQKSNFKSLLFFTESKNRIILIRIVVGLIFLSEGILKFLYPEIYGTGRFEKIGFSDPAFWAYFTGTFEILCSILLLLGFLTRIASIPLIIVMLTAFVTTKWPILMSKGFWTMAHEYRTDFAMTILLVYLLLYGAGKFSIDSMISRSSKF